MPILKIEVKIDTDINWNSELSFTTEDWKPVKMTAENLSVFFADFARATWAIMASQLWQMVTWEVKKIAFRDDKLAGHVRTVFANITKEVCLDISEEMLKQQKICEEILLSFPKK